MRRQVLVEDVRTGRDYLPSSTDIEMRKLMQRAVETRNREAIQKLADKEALKVWGNTPNEKIPKFEVKREKVKLSAGIYNLVRQVLP